MDKDPAVEDGRQIGIANAIVAAYEVLKQYPGDEHHDEWTAVMATIKAIQKLQS